MNIGFLVLNNFKYDARVRKQSNVFVEAGHKVQIFAQHEKGLEKKEAKRDINIYRINLISKCLPKKRIFQLIKYIEYLIKVSLRARKLNYLFLSRAGSLPIGIIAKILSFNRLKLIYDTRELESESNNLSNVKKKIIYFIEKFSIPMVQRVLVVSESINNYYTKMYKINPITIPNSVYYNKIKRSNILRESLGISDYQKIFLYQGAFSKGRGIELILDTFKSLSNMNKELVLVLIGQGALTEYVKKASLEYENINYIPAIAPEALLDYTSSADYAFCIIENTCLSYYYSLPNKLFEYSLVGLPIISSNMFEIGTLIEKYNNGIVFEDSTKEGLINTINSITMKDYSEMSKNSLTLAKDYDWKKNERLLLDLIN